jgi:hypothetical protein
MRPAAGARACTAGAEGCSTFCDCAHFLALFLALHRDRDLEAYVACCLWLDEGELSPVHTETLFFVEHLLCSAELAQRISELCRHELADARCLLEQSNLIAV